jgi:hypothetical protein
MQRPIGFPIWSMHLAHIIHADIALHKIEKGRYSLVIGSEMI